MNIPVVKLFLVGVSRDCFPITLTEKRIKKVAECLKSKGVDFILSETIIENEKDCVKALKEAKDKGCNAACVYLGNYGPEIVETYFAKEFDGPCMFCAAAEDDKDSLFDGRGDAYCGMLPCSYNLAIRGIRAYIPKFPVGIPSEIADMIEEFISIAKVYIGVKGLKIIGFGPRPYDFVCCNAPIKPLYDLGCEVMENSELDLLEIYNKTSDDEAGVKEILKEMEAEVGNCSYKGILPKLARYEYALLKFREENLGAKDYAVFANKCWPAFETGFGFVPCYVNSRLTAKGIPTSCEVDMYGALSEYICLLASGNTPTLLDINNSVPYNMSEEIADLKGCKPKDLFMGFHCGNTATCNLKAYDLKYQLIMKRSLEPDGEPDITRGTLEGQIKASPITIFRLHSSADCKLSAYMAQGEVLDKDPKTFGGVGIFAIPGMMRFYRYVLLAHQYPHHTSVAFDKVGKILFEAVKLLGVDDVYAPLPKETLYPGENPF